MTKNVDNKNKSSDKLIKDSSITIRVASIRKQKIQNYLEAKGINNMSEWLLNLADTWIDLDEKSDMIEEWKVIFRKKMKEMRD